jgi:cytochrome b involved in lipid metabolism/sterol desaturase/sphingolipid hydroxylase (fatty acid hydroxylase superfamily)
MTRTEDMPQTEQKTSSQYSMEDIRSHNSVSNAWIVMSGGVYDVTKFLEMHPGGKDILFEHLGTDITELFISPQLHSHSQKAFRILANYRIGYIDLAEASQEFDSSDAISSLVDMNKPILPQVLSMDPSKYQQWIHQASGDLTMRIFQSNFFESLSRWPWWYIFPTWIPVILILFGMSLWHGHSLAATIFTFICGFFAWGLIEYLLHRFFFHVDTASKIGNFYHLFAHGLHHLSPLDPSRLTFPPIFAVFVALGLWQLVSKVIFFVPTLHALYAGGALGYMLYDACHYYFHHGDRLMWIGYLQWMKTRHLRHHYKDPTKNFGVTSPIFDILFGTSD